MPLSNELTIQTSILTIALTAIIAAVIALYFRRSSGRNHKHYDFSVPPNRCEARNNLLAELGAHLLDGTIGLNTVIHIITISSPPASLLPSETLIEAIRRELLKRIETTLQDEFEYYQINDLQSAIIQKTGRLASIVSLEAEINTAVSAPFSIDNKIITTPAHATSFTIPPSALSVDRLVSQLEAISRLSAHASLREYPRQIPGDDRANMARARNHADAFISIPQTVITYQPICSLLDGSTLGCEAKLCYQSTLLDFSVFSLERLSTRNYNLLLEAQKYIIRLACSEFACQEKFARLLIQCRVLHERNEEFLQLVRKVLLETGLAANRLEFEFDDSALGNFPRKALDCFEMLSAMHVGVSIRLHSADILTRGILDTSHIRALLLDSSLTRPMGDETNATRTIRSIVKFADQHGLVVRADGVDTRQELARLQLLCCHEAKGAEIGHDVPLGFSTTRH